MPRGDRERKRNWDLMMPGLNDFKLFYIMSLKIINKEKKFKSENLSLKSKTNNKVIQADFFK